MEHKINGEYEGDGEDEGEEEEVVVAHWCVVGGGVEDAGWGRGSVDVDVWGLCVGDEDGFAGGVGVAEGDVFCTLRGGSEVGSHG